ncbi:MAG: DUF1007 family protein [Rhodospirillales bacterium]
MTAIRSFLATCLCLVGFSAAAVAHPHVWVDVTTEMVSPPGKPLELVMRWRMDEFLSSALLEDFDQDRDGKLTETEIDAMRDTAFRALEGGHYFTIVVANGQDHKPSGAGEFTAVAGDGIVTYQFTLTFSDLPAAQTTKWDLFVYDAENYVDFQFVADRPSVVPGSCTSSLEDAPERTYYSGLLFARKVRINCAGS